MRDIKDKIPDITNLTTTAAVNTKIKEAKDEMSVVSGLATSDALTAVESKIPNVGDLVKKKQIMMKKYFKYYDLILILILIFLFNVFMQKN